MWYNIADPGLVHDSSLQTTLTQIHVLQTRLSHSCSLAPLRLCEAECAISSPIPPRTIPGLSLKRYRKLSKNLHAQACRAALLARPDMNCTPPSYELYGAPSNWTYRSCRTVSRSRWLQEQGMSLRA